MQYNKEASKNKKKCIPYFKNKISYLTIANNNILVMSSVYPSKSPTAIKISKNLDIELGRDIEQFNELLSRTRIPIIFEKMEALSKNDNLVYCIIRMQTDNVGDEILGNIVCDNNGLIKKLICTKLFKREEDYLKYEEIGSLWKIRSTKAEKESDNVKKLEYLIKAITDFDMLTDASIETSLVDNKYEVYVKSLEMNYKYTFMLNMLTNKFELVIVSLE